MCFNSGFQIICYSCVISVIRAFNNVNQSKTNNHQIDLTEIEQEDKDIDEKVLEIPAFLRRQAN